MSKSKVCLILSAFIYGFAPILAKFAYKSGANGITLTFLRTFLMLPLLFFIMIFRKVSFKLTKKELIDIILLGVVGGSFSMISLMPHMTISQQDLRQRSILYIRL